MAQKVQTLFIDDIDGSEAEGTIRFGLDGTDYEIDLNGKHAKALREVYADFISHARKVARGMTRPGRSRNRPRIPQAAAAASLSAAPVDTNTVRAWAKEAGIKIKERGRVPQEIATAFVTRDPALIAKLQGTGNGQGSPPPPPLSPRSTALIESYDGWTIGSLRGRLRTLDADQIDQLIAHEKARQPQPRDKYLQMLTNRHGKLRELTPA